MTEKVKKQMAEQKARMECNVLDVASLRSYLEDRMQRARENEKAFGENSFMGSFCNGEYNAYGNILTFLNGGGFRELSRPIKIKEAEDND